MPRQRGGRSRYRNKNVDNHGLDHHHHHGVDKRHTRAKRSRANISSSALRRMVLNSTSTTNQETLVILGTYYRRFDDGTSFHDGHSFYSYQRRAQIINSCFTNGRGRFGLGVQTKRFLAITELADEFMVPRGGGGNWGPCILPDMLEHSIINEEMFYSDEENFEL